MMKGQPINVLEPSWMLNYFFLLGKSSTVKGQKYQFMLIGF